MFIKITGTDLIMFHKVYESHRHWCNYVYSVYQSYSQWCNLYFVAFIKSQTLMYLCLLVFINAKDIDIIMFYSFCRCHRYWCNYAYSLYQSHRDWCSYADFCCTNDAIRSLGVCVMIIKSHLVITWYLWNTVNHNYIGIYLYINSV